MNRYYIKENYWEEMKCSFPFYAGSLGFAVEKGKFLLFGGYLADKIFKRTNCIFEVSINEEESDPKIEIKYRNSFTLPIAEGFWCDQIIRFQGTRYVLQNIHSPVSDFLDFTKRIVLEISDQLSITVLGVAH